MKDDVLICMLPTECDVAYLSPVQVEHYGGEDEAKRILGVGYIATPEVFHSRTIGQLPDFSECGHA